jgi:uncharacterized membrane protein
MFLTIFDRIQDFLQNLVEKIHNFIINMLSSNLWWLCVIIALLAVILVIVGLVTLIIKSWKALIVIAVLGIAGFLVYYFVIKNGGTSTAEMWIRTFGLLI